MMRLGNEESGCEPCENGDSQRSQAKFDKSLGNGLKRGVGLDLIKARARFDKSLGKYGLRGVGLDLIKALENGLKEESGQI